VPNAPLFLFFCFSTIRLVWCAAFLLATYVNGKERKKHACLATCWIHITCNFSQSLCILHMPAICIHIYIYIWKERERERKREEEEEEEKEEREERDREKVERYVINI